MSADDEFRPDDAFLAKRRARNNAIGIVLLSLAALFFLITLVRLQQ